MKTLQRTLTIIKPDAVSRNAIGDIIEQFEKNGFRILAMKMLEISKHQAEQFYAVHASTAVFQFADRFHVERTDRGAGAGKRKCHRRSAQADGRHQSGATPKKARSARSGRANIEHNAIHGSDADDTARFELSYFFAGYELAK